MTSNKEEQEKLSYNEIYMVVEYRSDLAEFVQGIFSDLDTAREYVKSSYGPQITHPAMIVIRHDPVTTPITLKYQEERYPDGFFNDESSVIERKFIGIWTQELKDEFADYGYTYKDSE